MIVEQTALPEQIGLSSARLRNLESVLESYIEREVIAGAVASVGRSERIGYLAAFGQLDVAAARPMRPNAIFRLASMTKPVISVAVLMLLEEGKLLLTEPVSKYIPAFKAMQVAVRGRALPRYAYPTLPADGYQLVPAEREITIRDLLTHTSGLGSATAGPGFAAAQA